MSAILTQRERVRVLTNKWWYSGEFRRDRGQVAYYKLWIVRKTNKNKGLAQRGAYGPLGGGIYLYATPTYFYCFLPFLE